MAKEQGRGGGLGRGAGGGGQGQLGHPSRQEVGGSP